MFKTQLYDEISSFVPCAYDLIYVLDGDRMAALAREIQDQIKAGKFKSEIAGLVEAFTIQEEEQRQEEIRRENSWSRRTCHTITNNLDMAARNVGNAIVKLGCLIGSIFKNIWIFLVYITMLVKAKKQGACPYFTFEGKKK